MAPYLLEKGYHVHGLIRPAATDTTERLSEEVVTHTDFHLHSGDVTDSCALSALLQRIKPDEIYHFAAQSHVGRSFDLPVHTTEVIALGTLKLLEAIRMHCPSAKLYQAGSSEMFGNAGPPPQNEDSAMIPQSPYAAAKLHAYHSVRLYREAYGLYAVSGILFNHESPLRGADFVTRKVTKAVAAFKTGRRTSPLALGNLDAMRDWGAAEDFLEAIWLMMRQEAPPLDLVIATGESRSVRDMVETAFNAADLAIKWRGRDLTEEGIDPESGTVRVVIDPTLYRPLEVYTLCGDAARAQDVLGWRPQRSFTDMIQLMVDADIKRMLRQTTE